MKISYRDVPYRRVDRVFKAAGGYTVSAFGTSISKDSVSVQGWQRMMERIAPAMQDGKHIVNVTLRRVPLNGNVAKTGDIYDVLDVDVRECEGDEGTKVIVPPDVLAKL